MKIRMHNARIFESAGDSGNGIAPSSFCGISGFFQGVPRCGLRLGVFLPLVLSGLFFASPRAFASGAVDFFDSGMAKQNKEDYYGASEDYQQALQANPSYGDAWFRLSEVTYAVGDYSLALTYLESAEKFAKNRTEIQNLRGMIYISLGRLDDAKKVFTDIIRTNPNNIDARFGLAEIDLFSGSFSGARQLYLDALKRQTNNRKALLSLALLSAEMGNFDATQTYIEQALKFHSGDAEVHYLAAYLSARRGDYQEAERRARAAVQIDGSFSKAYVLLANILFSQKRYDDTIDICSYLISKNRKTSEAWYLKGLSEMRRGESGKAVTTWSGGLDENPQDEMMRAALELAVAKSVPIEDSRRSGWASYHVQKARDYGKVFMGEESRYEYQRALKVDPNNMEARAEFAELLSRSGLDELYLQQLKFIKSSMKPSSEKPTRRENIVNYTIEAYESLMKYSLSSEWNVDPFYLDKVRWNIGVYYVSSPSRMVHTDGEEVVTGMISDIFGGIATTSVVIHNGAVSGYSEAYRLARKSKLDYFMIVGVEETEREISMDAKVYSGRTGTETDSLNYFRTGNDRFASILRAFRRDVLGMLPVRGKIIRRSVNDIVVDLGFVEGMKENAVLDVVKAGKIQTVDMGRGVRFDEKDSLGTITISKVGEEISQGVLEQNGFYDRVNVGDEVLVRVLPEDGGENAGAISDTSPAAGEDGDRILPAERKKLDANELGIVKTPLVLDLIRGIR